MDSSMPEQSMSVLGYGVCMHDDDYATSLGLSNCSVDASILPPMTRRRTSLATRMAITALNRACKSAQVDRQLPVIFSSTVGEMTVTNQLCQAIARAQYPLSPTLFHNSVHNSAAGYWSMTADSMAPMQSMAALEDSFAVSLLEAYCQLKSGVEQILLVNYDETMPEYLLKEYKWQASALAFVLGPLKTNKPTLSRPYQGGVRSTVDNTFSLASPVFEGFRLLNTIQNNHSDVQSVQISKGELPWLVNFSQGCQ